jgi:uncharacterized protein with FMN-binding domain
MRKKAVLITAGMALIAVLAVVAVNLMERSPPDIADPEPPHRTHIREHLAGTGLAFEPVEGNGLRYYTLHSADRQLAGFVLLGTEEGWTGPIHLFVRTDPAGVIERVQVWHHTETPIYVVGLDAFLATFAGYKADATLTWQEDVHGITGATMTAQAIIAAVRGAGSAASQRGIFRRGP